MKMCECLNVLWGGVAAGGLRFPFYAIFLPLSFTYWKKLQSHRSPELREIRSSQFCYGAKARSHHKLMDAQCYQSWSKGCSTSIALNGTPSE